MTTTHAALMIAVSALVTMGLRFLPFVIFKGRQTPDFIVWLGKVLPYSIMGMLVVFCLKDTSIFTGSHGVPEFLACVCVVALHLWKQNSLISIIGGTALYMVLVQMVFK